MAEFIAVFLLVTCKAAWYWWAVFFGFLGFDVWAEYRKIMRASKLHKQAKEQKKIWTGEEV